MTNTGACPASASGPQGLEKQTSRVRRESIWEVTWDPDQDLKRTDLQHSLPSAGPSLGHTASVHEDLCPPSGPGDAGTPRRRMLRGPGGRLGAEGV